MSAGLAWAAATLILYVLARGVHARLGRWWSGPALSVSFILLLAALLTSTSYDQYAEYSYAFVWMLGPATVAFALPLYRERALIRRHWAVMVAGVSVGSVLSLAVTWATLALIPMDTITAQSLWPRSMTSPFAMPFAAQIGGDPNLAALFVILTGVIGAAMGNLLLRLPIQSAMARGMALGTGAHGVGTSFAFTLGGREGAIAGLAMILTGLLNTLGLFILLLFM
jgi:putative effector of murein hydrolase